jgi:aminoglycoside phosphotransferase (APT) family kinase protein
VLDWEAASVAPPEVDLGWFIWFHEYFQRLAVRLGHDGAPELFRRESVIAEYTAITGRSLIDFDWFLVYAELRQALTSIRVSSRAVHFGERTAPIDPELLINQVGHLWAAIRGDAAI